LIFPQPPYFIIHYHPSIRNRIFQASNAIKFTTDKSIVRVKHFRFFSGWNSSYL